MRCTDRSTNQTADGRATNANRPPDDSLVCTKEPLMGTIVAYSPPVNPYPALVVPSCRVYPLSGGGQ